MKEFLIKRYKISIQFYMTLQMKNKKSKIKILKMNKKM